MNIRHFVNFGLRIQHLTFVENAILLQTTKALNMASDSKSYRILHYKKTWIGLIIIGVIIKIILLPIETGDFVVFLNPWIEFIKTHGYFSSLKYGFYDYTPSYIYILTAIAKIGLNPLYSIKIVSILFEYLAAYFIGKIVFLKYKNELWIWISLAVIPLLPSVVLNSSYLSQCDSIYASLVMGSIYFIIQKKQFLGVLFLAIAFAFKMQTAFILPLCFVMMLRGNIRWYYFGLIPIVFILSITPTWLFGRPFTELLKVYVAQTERFRFLTLNFPNIYIWISNDYYETVKIIGIILTFVLTLFTGFWLSRKRIIFSFETWIRLAFLRAIVVPYFLPGMHERYLYLGDILGVLYYFVLRKNIHLPIGILLVSLYSYIRCSRFNDILPMSPAFFIYSFVIIFTVTDFIKSLKIESNEI
jgi:Gpi18-like mannosyltransferase